MSINEANNGLFVLLTPPPCPGDFPRPKNPGAGKVKLFNKSKSSEYKCYYTNFVTGYIANSVITNYCLHKNKLIVNASNLHQITCQIYGKNKYFYKKDWYHWKMSKQSHF